MPWYVWLILGIITGGLAVFLWLAWYLHDMWR